jgi:hypothetical protein
MNKAFADHVTQTAFFLSVSKRQIEHLEHLLRHPWEDRPDSVYADYFTKRPAAGGSNLHKPDTWLRTFHSLQTKGLVIWIVQETKISKLTGLPVETGHWELTEAGRLLCSLLVEAGLISTPFAELRETA